MVPITDFIAAIELGSSKISGIAGKKGSDGAIQVLAYATEESSAFIRKGVIFNVDKAATALTSIINKLEAELNSTIGKVYVGISGQSMHTVRNVVVRDLKEETIISQQIVDSIKDENIAYPLVDKEILEVEPQEYKIGINLQIDPVGVAGSHIEGRFLNIVAKSSLKKNMELSFQQAKINIIESLISPLKAAQVILSPSELRSGAAIVDFGADTTTVSIFRNNILRFLTVIPLGGNTITQDITSLHLEEDEAEEIKKKYGNVLFAEENGEEEIVPIQLGEGKTIDPLKLNDIIEARAEEIIANVLNQIELSGYENNLHSGIVLTGGGINLRNLEELFRKKSKIKTIKTARFIRNEVNISAQQAFQKDGTENTILGLLFAGEANCYEAKKQKQSTNYTPTQEVVDTDLFSDDEDLEEQKRKALEEKKERERLNKIRKEEEKRKRKEEQANKPKWYEKLSQGFFSSDDELK